MALDLTKPPFQTERGEPMHFVGHTKDGRTVWEDKEGWVSSRRADGRLHDGGPDGDDVINAPPQPRTAYVTVYADGSHARVIGLVYPSRELAERYASADKRVVRIVPIELPPEKDNATQTPAA